MDIIFGSVSADQRQADIARQERGGSRIYSSPRRNADADPSFAFVRPSSTRARYQRDDVRAVDRAEGLRPALPPFCRCLRHRLRQQLSCIVPTSRYMPWKYDTRSCAAPSLHAHREPIIPYHLLYYVCHLHDRRPHQARLDMTTVLHHSTYVHAHAHVRLSAHLLFPRRC